MPICSGRRGAMFTKSSSAASTIVAAGAPSNWRRSLTRNVSDDSSGRSTKRARRSEAVPSLQASVSGANADLPLSSPSRKTRCTSATTSAPTGRSDPIPTPPALVCSKGPP